jgi:hypothetical protein
MTMTRILIATATLIALAAPAAAGQYDHLTGKDRDTLIGAAAWAVYYKGCGGNVSLAQWQSQVLSEFKAEVDGLTRIVKQKGVTCSQIKKTYPFIQEAARPIVVAEGRRNGQPEYNFDPEDKPNYESRPSTKPRSFPIHNVNGAALLAETVVTCNVKPTEAAVRDAMRMIDDLGYRDWLEVVSWVHLVWNDEAKKVFCDEALKILGPAIATGQDGAKIPEELDISVLTRRIYPYTCRKGPTLFATVNKEYCK